MRVLVTGADGFIGRGLVRRLLLEPSCSVVAAVRRLPLSAVRACDELSDGTMQWAELGDLVSEPALGGVFDGVDVVVHCAARVHVMRETDNDPIAAFRAVNLNGTLELARAAVHSGVRRFIFISSIKVHGAKTTYGEPFIADTPLLPTDSYAISKMEAEMALMALASDTGLEVVIVRPPLVYGPGVKANFHSMMKWLKRGVPLPLGAIRNRRSLVALDNLVDFLMVCMHHPNAAGQAFLVSDGEDLSTSDLLRRLGTALGEPARLIPVSPALLQGAGVLLGKRAVVERLCGSLQIDISKARTLLGWAPPVSVDSALASTAAAFVAGVDWKI